MADMPMEQPGAEPMQDEGPELVVCIEKYADGRIMVGLEPEEGAGEGGEPANEDAGMSPVKTVQEALQIARDLLTNPNVPGAEGQDAFRAGFAKTAPNPMDGMSTEGMR